MSSYGVVLDLLDDRYLNLQDVIGNVEPLPTLVPYEQYTQNMIVYKMEERHEFFVGRLHEFTDRTARLSDKELWTWFVQWEVEVASESPVEHAIKRPRLAASLAGSSSTPVPAPRKGPAYTVCERRTLRAELFEENDMLRILIDIVQVDSKLVPNYVEFLYQWIDFYEGDGKALKAAMRMEIPSLWLFEYHPLPIFGKTSGEDAENIGEKLIRKKPDIAAFEAMTEESERLQYREPRFGLQPPVDPKDEPLPPLINIPREEAKRKKYYAACFKNRQRAFWLLQEAGLSARQIANYKKLQVDHPKNTSEDVNGTGFVNYYREEPFAHEQFMLMEQMKKMREKQNEVAISNKLALEAQLAATTRAGSMLGEGSFGQRDLPPPLIPPTPTHHTRSNATMTILRRLAAIKETGERAINFLPPSILPLTKSNLFRYAKATRAAKPIEVHLSHLRHWPWSGDTTSVGDSAAAESDYGDISSSDFSDSEIYSGDDVDPDERADGDGEDHNMISYEGDAGSGADYDIDPDERNGSASDEAGDGGDPMDIVRRARPPFNTLPARTPLMQSAASTTSTASTVSAFMQGLNRTQLDGLLPLFNRQAQQAILQRTTALNATPRALASDQDSGSYPGPRAAAVSFSGEPSSGLPPRMPLPTIAQTGLTEPPRLNAQFGAQAATSSPVESSLQGQQLRPSLQPGLGVTPRFGPPLAPPVSTVNPALASTASTMSERALHNSTVINSQGRPVLTPTRLHESRASQTPGPSAQPRTVPAISNIAQGHGTFPVRQPLGTFTSYQDPPPFGGTQTVGAFIRPTAGFGASSLATPPESPGIAPSAGNLPPGRLLGEPTPIQSPQAPLGLPRGIGAFPPLPRQSLTQSSARAAPPASLNLQPPTGSFDSHNPTIQRPSPSPSLMTPLANLTGSLTLANPYAASPQGIPIQIYVPKIVMRPKTMPNEATDCLILGYIESGTGTLKLSRAIFLPVGVWENTLRRVRLGKFSVLETYAPPPTHPRFVAHKGTLTNPEQLYSPHKSLYDKLGLMYGFMANCVNREEELTKRWRATPGPLTDRKRGAVWEGYGVYVDRGIEMARKERKGALVVSSVDGPVADVAKNEDEERRKEIEEMLDEEMGDESELSGDEMED